MIDHPNIRALAGKLESIHQAMGGVTARFGFFEAMAIYVLEEYHSGAEVAALKAQCANTTEVLSAMLERSRIAHTTLESMRGVAGDLTNLADRVAVMNGGICNGDRKTLAAIASELRRLAPPEDELPF